MKDKREILICISQDSFMSHHKHHKPRLNITLQQTIFNNKQNKNSKLKTAKKYKIKKKR